MKTTAFNIVHPLVALIYFGAVIVLSMAVFHPVFLVVNALAAIGYNAYLKGASATTKTLLWQVPLLLIITLLNPIFVSSGSTELFRIGTQAFYLESLVYGACMGCMLVGMFMWFSNATHILGSDKLMSLFGKKLQTVGLMITMTMRLIPQFVRRGEAIAEANNACSSASKNKKTSSISQKLRQVTVLMGWSMEDSLESSDAMRAKGWGASATRTTYTRHNLKSFDVVMLVVLLALIVLDVVGAYLACSELVFYPVITGVLPCWFILSHIIVLAVPLYLELYVRMRS